jgi:hypothetical protein
MALALMAVACSTEVKETLQYGELSVALSGEPVIEALTKAPVALDPQSKDAENYTVRIFNDADAVQYEETYAEFAAQRLQLGTYYVTAENCTEAEAEAGNGKMRLYGRSADVNLSAEALSQTAEVGCTVANAKVSVEFDSSVQGRFSGLQVTLAGGTTPDRSLTIAQTEAGVITETWFNPSSLTYTISGTFTGSGMTKPVEIVKTITLEAKNNIKLLVRVNLENGQLSPSITVDTDIDNLQETTEEFNPYM